MANFFQLSQELKFLNHFVSSIVRLTQKTGDFSFQMSSGLVNVFYGSIVDIFGRKLNF